MRLEINLASEPFRRDRAMLVGSAAVGALLVVSLIGLLYLQWQQRQQLIQIDREQARLERELRRLDQQQAKLDGVLRRPGNAAVLDRNLFYNTLLQRKGISWTRIFTDLQGVLPPNVRLISVRPQVSGPNDVKLDMVVGATGGDAVATFLEKLERTAPFGGTVVQGSNPPSQTEPLYRYRVSVNYAQKL